MLLWTFGFRKMFGNSWVVKQVVASKDGLISMELVSCPIYWDQQEENVICITQFTGNALNFKNEIMN
jgi:hypothetical protein